MYCRNCGHEIKEGDTFCTNCGAFVDSDPVNDINNNKTTNYNSEAFVDNGNPLVGVLSFFIPVLGIILFIVWKKEKPKSAKHAGIGALVSIIMSILSCLMLFFGLLMLL